MLIVYPFFRAQRFRTAAIESSSLASTGLLQRVTPAMISAGSLAS
jgi:hypothetical protein